MSDKIYLTRLAKGRPSRYVLCHDCKSQHEKGNKTTVHRRRTTSLFIAVSYGTVNKKFIISHMKFNHKSLVDSNRYFAFLLSMVKFVQSYYTIN